MIFVSVDQNKLIEGVNCGAAESKCISEEKADK